VDEHDWLTCPDLKKVQRSLQDNAVTEREWLTCVDPNPMLRVVELGRKTTSRKLRLFGVACCRRLWAFLDDEGLRQIVEVAEGYADGANDDANLQAAQDLSYTLCEQLKVASGDRRSCVLANAAVAANWVSARDTRFQTNEYANSLYAEGYHSAAAGYIAGSAAQGMFYATYEGADALEQVRRRTGVGRSTSADPVWAGAETVDLIWAGEEAAQADLLRCVVGNPFRPAPIAAPSWLTWAGGTVVMLARSIYDGRAFDQLPILADALEEAGCTDRDILAHLRGPGPHCRGCWSVDLMLGKE
jgi:hypothetical protein